METRGIRNKNPFNVKFKQSNNWRGQIGSDGVFCQFRDFDCGLRAGLYLLMRYYVKYHLTTPRLIVSRFCPDNTVNDYLVFIQKRSNSFLQADKKITSLLDMLTLACCMCYFESNYDINVTRMSQVYNTLPSGLKYFKNDMQYSLNFEDYED